MNHRVWKNCEGQRHPLSHPKARIRKRVIRPAVQPRFETPELVREIAALQGGVVTNKQLRECGVSSKQRLVRFAIAGWKRHLGVVVIPECVTNNDLRDAWALTLRIGPSAIVTGPTAARLQGIPVDHTMVIAISELDHHARAFPARIRRRPPIVPAHPYGELQFVSAEEALLDTLEAMPRAEAIGLLETALQRRWITPKFIAHALRVRTERGQHRGSLKRFHALAHDGTHSHAERRMKSLLRKHQLTGWTSDHRIDDASGRPVAAIDLAHVRLKIAIEVDGHAFHSQRREFERDRLKQNELVIAGWTVLRFTWDQISNHGDDVVSVVREAIHRCTGTPAQNHRSTGTNRPLAGLFCP